jgi:exocyst complex component 8
MALTSTLTTSLLSALASTSARKSRVVLLITLLKRVRAGAAARDAFLTARAQTLKKSIKAIKVGGDEVAYVHDLAIVVFNNIRHTADWYLAAFRENEYASGMPAIRLDLRISFS